MVRIKTFITLSLVLSLCSCATLRKSTNHNDIIELNPENSVLINGKYAIKSLPNKDSITGGLYWNIFDRGYNGKNSVQIIELCVIEDKRVRVSLYDGDSITKSKVFKGKYKDGYFQFKRRWFVVPGLYLNVFRNRMFRIGILKNKNIITDYNQVAYGTGFFIIPFYEKKQQFNVEFKRNKYLE